MDCFADFFNAKLFQGRQTILPEELEEIDSEADILLEDKAEKTKAVQKYRDVVMRWRGSMNLVLLACENQKKVHYAMPVRNMLYDSLSYTEQIRQLWNQHEGKEIKLTQEEYLSRFRKGDKIYPIITLVWYYGLEPWDGSRDLYGMFSSQEIAGMEELLKKYVPNYHINLVDANNIGDIKRFQTDLQQIFGMLKYRGDKEKLVSYTKEEKKYFQHVNQETYFVMEELLSSKRLLNQVASREEWKEDVDMCKALEDLYQEGVEKGREEGRKEVREEMCKEFVEVCQELGASKEKTSSKLAGKFGMDLESAAELVKKYWK